MKANELKLLWRINQAAKFYGAAKKTAYHEHEYDKCAEYKFIQNQIYLVKDLTIIRLKNKGILKFGATVLDQNGCPLKNVESQDATYKFHVISDSCDDVEVVELIKSDPAETGAEIYLPYLKYLASQLDEKGKLILNTLTEVKFEIDFFGYKEKSIQVIKKLEECGATVYWTGSSWDGIKNYMSIVLEDVRLANVLLYAPEGDVDEDLAYIDDCTFLAKWPNE